MRSATGISISSSFGFVQSKISQITKVGVVDSFVIYKLGRTLSIAFSLPPANKAYTPISESALDGMVKWISHKFPVDTALHIWRAKYQD